MMSILEWVGGAIIVLIIGAALLLPPVPQEVLEPDRAHEQLMRSIEVLEAVSYSGTHAYLRTVFDGQIVETWYEGGAAVAQYSLREGRHYVWLTGGVIAEIDPDSIGPNEAALMKDIYDRPLKQKPAP